MATRLTDLLASLMTDADDGPSREAMDRMAESGAQRLYGDL